MERLTQDEIRYLYAGGWEDRERRLAQIRIARAIAKLPLPTGGIEENEAEEEE